MDRTRVNELEVRSIQKGAFIQSVRAADSRDALLDICRRRVLHGLPFVFGGQEDPYYAFRSRIARKFEISFHEIYITGSAKLGFSLLGDRLFDLDSDIDVAITSPKLYVRILSTICDYQMELREARRSVSERELVMYHQFLEYTAIGWIRPDKLPLSFNVGRLKREWFDFFQSLSHGQSEVGDYKVAAGVFRAYEDLERYAFSGLLRLRQSLDVEARK